MTAKAKNLCWPNINRDIKEKIKPCIACLASGKNVKYQILMNKSGKLKSLPEPGLEIQIDFNGKLQNQLVNGENQVLIAIDRLSKRPTVKTCKTSER